MALFGKKKSNDDPFGDVAETGATPIDVSGNDVEGADGAEWSLLSGASHGTATYVADGVFNYTPDANYSGADSFTYTITDTDGDTATATVTVNVPDDSHPTVEVTDGAVYESALTGPPAGSGTDIGGSTVTTGTISLDVGADVPAVVQILEPGAGGNWITVTAGGTVNG